MAAKHKIVVDQGSYWSLLVTWKDSDGAPINITDWTARMQIRLDYNEATPALVLTDTDGITLGGTAGTILLEIVADKSSSLNIRGPKQDYVYDLELVPPTGEANSKRLMQGPLTVTREVTRS